MTHISIITNIIPQYREGFYDNIKNSSFKIHIYCQSKIPGQNFKTIHERYRFVKLVKFISFGKEKLNIQLLPIFKILRYSDVIVIDGNPRYISHFILSLIALLFNKKVIIWTMAHTFTANYFLEKIRLNWTKMFKYILVYNSNEVEYLLSRGFNKHVIIGINNGLNQKKIDGISAKWDDTKLADWKIKMGYDNKKIILSSARLLYKNRFDLMMLAFANLISEYEDLIWVIIGDGEEKEKLELMSNKLDISEKVKFIGSIYNEDELAPFFMSSLFLVHPSSIGLTLLHSFGYGLPVITNDDVISQGPEFTALIHNLNGLVFKKGDINSLLINIKYLLDNNKVLINMRNAALESVRYKYNTDVMYNNFIKIINLINH